MTSNRKESETVVVFDEVESKPPPPCLETDWPFKKFTVYFLNPSSKLKDPHFLINSLFSFSKVHRRQPAPTMMHVVILCHSATATSSRGSLPNVACGHDLTSMVKWLFLLCGWWFVYDDLDIWKFAMCENILI